VAEPDAIDTDARMKQDPGFIYRGLLKTYRPTKPVIAAVEGVAIAGGTEILQGTDIRIAAESARFGVSEARWSLYPMGGSAVRLRRQVPYAVAADILLTGKHITAADALHCGLVSYVVPDGTALDKAAGRGHRHGNGRSRWAILRTLALTEHDERGGGVTFEQPIGMAVMASADSEGRGTAPRAFQRSSGAMAVDVHTPSSRRRGVPPAFRDRARPGARAGGATAAAPADPATRLLAQVGPGVFVPGHLARATRAPPGRRSALPPALVADLGVLQQTPFSRARPSPPATSTSRWCVAGRRSTATPRPSPGRRPSTRAADGTRPTNGSFRGDHRNQGPARA
jgi:hypothetical protein